MTEPTDAPALREILVRDARIAELESRVEALTVEADHAEIRAKNWFEDALDLGRERDASPHPGKRVLHHVLNAGPIRRALTTPWIRGLILTVRLLGTGREGTVSDSGMHEYIYSDPKRVREARVQAEGRVAYRRLRKMLFDAIEPVMDRLNRMAGGRRG